MNRLLGNQSGRRTISPSVASIVTGTQSSSDDNAQAVDISSSEYARRRREMMQLALIGVGNIILVASPHH